MVGMNKVSKVFVVASLLLAGSYSVYAMDQDDDWKTHSVFKGSDEELFALIKAQEESLKVKRAIPIHLTPTTCSLSYVEEEDGAITITTDNNAEASYQAESERIFVKEGDIINVPYKVKVAGGGIASLGLLNSNRNGWYGDELVLREGVNEGIYTRKVPALETEFSLVFRNYHLVSNGGPGQSIFTIEACDIQKGENFELNAHSIPVKVNKEEKPINSIEEYKKIQEVIEVDFDELPAEKIWEYIQAQEQSVFQENEDDITPEEWEMIKAQEALLSSQKIWTRDPGAKVSEKHSRYRLRADNMPESQKDGGQTKGLGQFVLDLEKDPRREQIWVEKLARGEQQMKQRVVANNNSPFSIKNTTTEEKLEQLQAERVKRIQEMEEKKRQEKERNEQNQDTSIKDVKSIASLFEKK